MELGDLKLALFSAFGRDLKRPRERERENERSAIHGRSGVAVIRTKRGKFKKQISPEKIRVPPLLGI